MNESMCPQVHHRCYLFHQQTFIIFLETHSIFFNTSFTENASDFPRFQPKLLFLSATHLQMYLCIYSNVLFKFSPLCFCLFLTYPGMVLLYDLFFQINRPGSSPSFISQFLLTVQLTLSDFSLNSYFIKSIMCYFYRGNQIVSCLKTKIIAMTNLFIYLL